MFVSNMSDYLSFCVIFGAGDKSNKQVFTHETLVFNFFNMIYILISLVPFPRKKVKLK